ncbi:unnamed protein product, partial [Symbiodinium microadriaticum]
LVAFACQSLIASAAAMLAVVPPPRGGAPRRGLRGGGLRRRGGAMLGGYRVFGPETGPLLLALRDSGIFAPSLAERFPETGLRVIEVQGGVTDARALLQHLPRRPFALASADPAERAASELGIPLWVVEPGMVPTLEERARFYALLPRMS